MAVFNNVLAGAAGQAGGAAAGYEIERSLRFDSSSSSYLNRTPSSAGNRKTWTWAGWVKRSALQSGTSNTHMQVFSAGTSGAARDVFFFDTDTDDALAFYSANGLAGAGILMFRTNAVFRDASAWYHIVLAVDTTQSTAANRVKLYVNGAEQTFSTVSYPSQDAEGYINLNNAHYIATHPSLTEYFNGYLADVHFIDGQALDPTDFGEFDDNGVWQPIEYTGTYGTNGFHLDFSDNSTAAALGTDAAGSNDWTVNNISVTAGAGNDSLLDSPQNGTQTDTGAGGEVSGNYCTWNPLIVTTNNTLSEGNLQASHAASTGWTGNSQQATSAMFVGNMGMSSGKWYWEIAIDSATNSSIGIVNRPGGHNNYVGYSNNGIAEGWGWSSGGTIYHTSGITNDGGTLNGYAVDGTSILGFALDMDNGRLYVSNNGTYENSGDPELETGYCASGMSGTYYFAASQLGSNSTWTGTVNTGQRPFAYTAPSGYKALCTTNLTDPTIADGSDYMDVALYTGTGSSLTVSGLGFSPDFVWLKNRGNAASHRLTDIVRGATKSLFSDSTTAELTETGSLTAFTSDGFTLGTGGGVNNPGTAAVAWTWDAGTSTVSNTDGSITSSVRANASAGFSIVTYTGTQVAATVGHGLGAAPHMILCKTTSVSANWTIYHVKVGEGARLKFTTAASQPSTAYWNNTAPTSTVFSLATSAGNNASSASHVAYCFAPVEGYSAFGSYTGNGIADGPFVYTGFRPRWIMWKKTNSSTNAPWVIVDTSRSSYNLARDYLLPNDSAAETSVDLIDVLSNGFKWRGTAPGGNASGDTYIYAAFAENPFKTARAR